MIDYCCFFEINLTFCTQISTFWAIPNVVLKSQYSDQFLIFQSNSNNLIDFHFCNRISTFDRSALFRSNFNILINSHLIALKCQLFDWFPTFHSNYNILNDLVIITQISIFWLIPKFVLNFNILINSLFFNQIQIFGSIPTLVIKYQHFDWFQNLNLKALMPITFSSPGAQPEVVYFLISNESSYFFIANPKFQLQILCSFGDITISVKLIGIPENNFLCIFIIASSPGVHTFFCLWRVNKKLPQGETSQNAFQRSRSIN